jgi:predicted N-acetyltransferase YhbS
VLGDDMATIGSVGVAETARRSGIGGAMVARASQLLSQAGARNCHIGWVGLQIFYEQLGYRRWRDYAMSRRSLKHSWSVSESHTARRVMAESPEERQASAEREPSRAAQATEPEALEGEEGAQAAP